MTRAQDPPAVVLFDLGGVVCRFDPQPRLDTIADECGLSAGEVHERVWGAELSREFDAGHYTTAEWFDLITELLRWRADFVHFRDVMLSALTPDNEMLALVDEVRPHARTAMLTDSAPLLLEAMPRRFPQLVERFDPMLFSCELGALKPSREAFDAAIERLGEPAERVLFIDDTQANVKAARALGMRAHRFTSVEGARAELARRLPIDG